MAYLSGFRKVIVTIKEVDGANNSSVV